MTVHLVVPRGVDDPARPSGGNVYDRRVADGLRARGHEVVEHLTSPAGLEAALTSVPGGATVVVDGLVGCFAPGPSNARRPGCASSCSRTCASPRSPPDAAEDERRALLAADRW